ncbi:hypothetical protein P7K49_016367 [Saguinus oedipus]|uniref:Uncharacterized protein n=1 Tax=Saguinus oedipus TaxID=9490 RepID=A0ABQ9VDV3_SAGOE|nr:hypothetical protein P7K49_016367 [Saguinus oedipus]
MATSCITAAPAAGSPGPLIVNNKQPQPPPPPPPATTQPPPGGPRAGVGLLPGGKAREFNRNQRKDSEARTGRGAPGAGLPEGLGRARPGAVTIQRKEQKASPGPRSSSAAQVSVPEPAIAGLCPWGSRLRPNSRVEIWGSACTPWRWAAAPPTSKHLGSLPLRTARVGRQGTGEDLGGT